MQVQKESEKSVEGKSTGLLNATPEMPYPALLGEKITAMPVLPFCKYPLLAISRDRTRVDGPPA